MIDEDVEPEAPVIPVILPQLADSIDKKNLPKYLPNDRYFFEQKIDGFRKLVWLRNGQVEILNRQGKPEASGTPGRIYDELGRLESADVALDCELIDTTLWVFDLPYAAGLVTPAHPYEFRRGVLDKLIPVLESESVRILPCARTPEQKLALSRQVITNGGEGLMVKDSQAKYLSGKRHGGLLKAKFVKDVDAYITRFGIGLSSNGSGQPKSNCELAVKDAKGKEVIIAECIIHPKERALVDIGSVVTVAYLYCVDPDAPRLVQPTRIRPRDDKYPDECSIDQLRFTDKSVITREVLDG